MGKGTINEPEVTIVLEGASVSASNAPQQVLLVGQMLAAGTAVGGDLITKFPNDGSEDVLFGARAVITNMIKAFKKLNEETRIDIIPIEDAGSPTQSAGTIVFTGTATEAGVLTIWIGSGKTGVIELGIASGASVTVIGDALVAAMLALTNLPVTGVNTAGSVAITAENGGTIGDLFGLRVQGEVAGITVAVGAMSGGATDPTVTGMFSVVGDERYQTIIYPGNFTLNVLTDFLDPRFNATNEIVDGIGIISKTDDFATIDAFGNTLNSQSLIVMANTPVNDTLFKGSSMFELDDVYSASIGALRSKRLTEGVNIADILVGEKAADAFGGPALSSRPYANTPVAGLTIIDIGKGFTSVESKTLEASGISLVGNNPTRTAILMGVMVTTYKTDAAGNPDPTFTKVNFVDTSSNIREFFFNNYKKKFAQTRLTDGDLVETRPMENEGSILALNAELYTELSTREFALTRAGNANLKAFKDGTIISIDLQAGLVTLIFKVVPIVTQLQKINSTMAIAFDL